MGEDIFWAAPAATEQLDATVRVPGSKSITNRAYVLAALSQGETVVREPLDSRDTRLMLAALDALGARSEPITGGVRIRPLTDGDDTDPVTIALGNAGTVARFTPALATLGSRSVHFDGDPAIRRRPVGPLLRALAALGADLDDGGRGAVPFTVRGQGHLPGGTVPLDSSASSQFLSALLLAAPASDHGVTVRLQGNPPSEPHIAMTLDMLRRFGAEPERGSGRFHVPAATLALDDFTVEPDLSGAAPFALAPLLTGGSIHVSGWPSRTTQPGDWVRDLVRELGGTATLDDTGLTVTGTGRVAGRTLHLNEVGELTPVVAALLCFADGPSEISGVAHLRGHETDRLAALATELSALGGDVTETEDGLRIRPVPLHGGTFHTYDDHRLVMAGAVLALRVPGVRVQNPETVGKTFPGFVDLWEHTVGAPASTSGA